MNKLFITFLLCTARMVVGMDVKSADCTDPIREINFLPCVINSSGSYQLSSQAMYHLYTRRSHFDSAIRIYNNARVALDLNGNVLQGNGRTFGVDANFAASVFIYNGTISGATRAISSLNNEVRMMNVRVYACASSSIETTKDKTHMDNVSFVSCGNLK